MVTNNITIYLNNYHLMAKKYRFILLLLILTLVQARATASATAKPAYWIAVPQTSAHDYGVYYFRKNLNLTQLPAAMRVEVSGDNRYTSTGSWLRPAQPKVIYITGTTKQ